MTTDDGEMRRRPEAAVRLEFATAPAALGAALSELVNLSTFPEMRAAVLRKLKAQPGEEEPAFLGWASDRGYQWLRPGDVPGPGLFEFDFFSAAQHFAFLSHE